MINVHLINCRLLKFNLNRNKYKLIDQLNENLIFVLVVVFDDGVRFVELVDFVNF